MKKIILLLLVLLVWNGCSPGDLVNLIKNNSFENAEQGIPADWQKDVWGDSPELVDIQIENEDAFNGQNYITIRNQQPGDSKLVQFVTVEPDKTYRISGYIKTDTAPGSGGANLSVLGILASSEPVYNTNGSWKYVEFYGKTGPAQKSAPLAVRLGNYGQLTSGKASFDQIRMEKVSSVPAGGKMTRLFITQKKSAEEDSSEELGYVNNNPLNKRVPLSAIHSTTILYLIIFGIFYVFLIHKEMANKLGDTPTHVIYWGLIMGAGLILRVWLAQWIIGYQSDIGLFRYWSDVASSVPFSEYYDKLEFCDYPPGYITILAWIGHIKKFLHIPSQTGLYFLLLKSPAIIADMITCGLIFVIAQKKVGRSIALALGFLYLFNPVVLLNSAVWGQVDSISALCAMMVLYFIIEEKFWISSLILGFAVLIKLQTGFVGFILLFAIIKRIVEKGDWMCLLKSAAAGIGIFTLIVLPFGIGKPPLWIFEFILKTMSGYKYASVNAFNFMSLFGGNWTPPDRILSGFAPFGLKLSYGDWSSIFGIITLTLITVFYFLGKKDQPENKDDSKNFLVSLFFIGAVFVFFIVMHERYMYPVVLLSLMSYVYTKDRRLLFVFLAFSVSNYYNVGYILDILIKGEFIQKTDPLMINVSLANIGIMLYLLKVMVERYFGLDFLNGQKLFAMITEKTIKKPGNKKNKKKSVDKR